MKPGEAFLAARYAAAYDSLAASAEQAQANLAAYGAALAELAEAREYLLNPVLPFGVKAEILDKTFAVKSAAHALIKLLVEQKRFSLAPAVGEQIQKLADIRAGVKRVFITEAAPTNRQKIEEVLSRYFGGKIAAQYAQDKALLAGITVRQQDILIDASALGRAEQLKKFLTGGK